MEAASAATNSSEKSDIPPQPTEADTIPARNPFRRAGIVVFSGGSAANNLVDVFKAITEGKQRPLSYVIPISDNGGSSSELIRVFGGPGEYKCTDTRKNED